jgi:hypothetical protein
MQVGDPDGLERIGALRIVLRQEFIMTDASPQTRDAEIEREAEALEKDLEAADRPDRAVPLEDDDANDEGVGPVTGVVP